MSALGPLGRPRGGAAPSTAEILLLITSATEVGERCGLESQVRQAQRLEDLGLLAGGVAHDFNNLLVPIMGNAELIRDEGVAETQAEMLDDICAAGERAKELLLQLLTYAGRNRPALEPVDLSTITSEMRGLLAASIPKDITLEEHFDPQTVVRGDPVQLRQLVMNLILNASEAIGDRPGTIQLSVRLHGDGRQSEPQVLLQVSDDGVGMDADTVERLFTPFFTTKFAGRGLGMAVVHGIVQAHHGHIDVDSQQGRGSTFRVRLPALLEPLREQAALPTIGNFPHCTVLIADDEPSVRRLLTKMLEHEGVRVLRASDGREAVEQFKTHQREIDLVLLDVTMPVQDGADALLAIHGIKPNVPAVFMSGYAQINLAARLPSGVPLLRKPFRKAALFGVLAQVMPGFDISDAG